MNSSGHKDAQNYYLLYRQVGGTSRLYISEVVNGVEQVLKYTAISNPTRNVFFRIEGRLTGTTLKLLLDGVEKLSVADTTTTAPFTPGSAGILMGSKYSNSCLANNFSATAQ